MGTKTINGITYATDNTGNVSGIVPPGMSTAQFGASSGGGAGTGPGGYFDQFSLKLNPIDNSKSPYFQAMQNRAQSFQPAQGLATTGMETGSPYSERNYSGALPEFDQMRAMAGQKLNQQAGAARDNLNRQFAALGGGPSGAQIKATQQLEQNNAETQANTMNQIGMQEAQTRRGLQETEHQRGFQAQQEQSGRNLSREQMNTGIGEFNSNLAMQNQTMPFELNSKLASLDMGAQSQNNEYLMQQFNAAMERYKAQMGM